MDTCKCGWPRSVCERMADWFMAPLDWACDLPTPRQRLAGILLVMPISWFAAPALLLMCAEAILDAIPYRIVKEKH